MHEDPFNFKRYARRLAAISVMLFMTSCQSKLDVTAARGSSQATTELLTAKSSSSSEAILQNVVAKVTVPAGAFAKESTITLKTMTKTEFLEQSGLGADTNIIAGPVLLTSTLTGTTTASNPQSALSVKLTIPAGKSADADTVAVIIATAADGTRKVFFVAHDDLVFTIDPTTGLTSTQIAKLISGNFSVALISGLTKESLAEKFSELPDDGAVSSGSGGGVASSVVPTHAATLLTFSDGDSDGMELSGTLNITKASSESDVSSYVLYWGASATLKRDSTPITTIAATGSNLSYVFSANTTVPTSPTATHLLVYTKNAVGEMATPTAYLIIDLGVPTNAAVGVALTDTDNDTGQIAGTVNITKAVSETDLTHYVLYWGTSTTAKQNATPITTIAATGSNVSYNMPANTAIPTGPTATHLLVFTKNSDGEMATGVSVAISDVGPPVNPAASIAFTDGDTDPAEISGTLTINKATSESDVTHYVLYWGSDATTKQNATPITNIAVTGANVTYNFGASTAIPSGATHFLVRTKNAIGEMATGAALAISDAGSSLSITAYPTAADNINNTLAWSNPSNALAADSSYATVFNSGGGGITSDQLRVQGYDFSALPMGATITGFKVSIAEHSTFSSTVSDHTVSLLKAGSVVGSPVTDPTYWPQASATIDRGGDGNLWGTTWTRAEVISAGFGVVLRVVFAGNSGAYVDSIAVTVYYTP